MFLSIFALPAILAFLSSLVSSRLVFHSLIQETVDAGAHEFAETEQFLRAAEDVCGPYVWGNYDILLLPPSFPYGGMENPQVCVCLWF
jgi:hypothetical protein